MADDMARGGGESMNRRFVVDSSDVNSQAFVGPACVLLNGEDVSHKCFRAVVYSDGTGAAYCYKTRINEKGQPEMYSLDGKSLEKETLNGKVQVIRPAFAAKRIR